ncbi:radical SAM family heme chaperone HemW [Pseudalkalibacillus salsuginis]|uniref:radical SAM family heme chaperone HemW n=1 Tax=Pseudalkalibacillus salsuginis TaxID=2910972 RepID=UPI001F3E7AB4|nr:radical SAM family heme chaperone HemW [Pseudalkalibacillus salsuginis]MCF6408547.1 radical SAM family heme chaperone HemW [Pseudalkalibacillus salsuginis]
MTKAAYIHIPFCEQICHYCDFNKFLIKGQPVYDYLDAMEVEIKKLLDSYPARPIETIYIGGGTPTALEDEQLKRMLDIVTTHLQPIDGNIEFTVEANPSVTERKKLRILKNAGVNRLSIGVQAFQDSLLSALNRNHRREDVARMIREAHSVGFENISIDLMFGLPGQTLEMFQESVSLALQLNVPHISAYSLQVENQTVFGIRDRKGELSLPGEEKESDMFEYLIDILKQKGFLHYEISNFAKAGFESKHNQVYWKNEPYYGIGAGAHGYVKDIRYENVKPLPHYIRKLGEGGFPHRIVTRLDNKDRMEEEIFLGLRRKGGVNKETFYKKYNRPIEDVFPEQIDKLTAQGLLVNDTQSIRLTEKGLFLGNEVFQEFIGVI